MTPWRTVQGSLQMHAADCYNTQDESFVLLMRTIIFPKKTMEAITKLLSKEEIILPGSSLYEDECKTWDAHKNLHPQVIARPGSLESLSRLIVFLCNSELDFTIRSSGTGSASARDVLVSMAAFDGFEWDASSETITIGTGQTWGEVDRKMEEADPDYAGRTSDASTSHEATDLLQL